MKSPALSDFIKKVISTPLIELPSLLESFPTRWDFPRGDLYHWIGPLNRFDEILEHFIEIYELGARPQTKKFGKTQLLEDSQSAEAETRSRELEFEDDGDRKLVESVLDFSRLLLEKCGNRSLYNSGERLNALLNTTSLTLLHSTLRLALCLAQRYHARHRPAHFHMGSLPVHYGLDLDRIQSLAAPTSKHQVLSRRSAPSSPVKVSKGKEKYGQLHSLTSPNDLLSLTRESPLANGKTALHSSDTDSGGPHPWEEWAGVQVVFQPEIGDESNDSGPSGSTDASGHERLNPLRRQSINQVSKLNRVSTSDDSTNGTNPSAANQANAAASSPQRFEPPVSTLQSSLIEHVLKTGLSVVPKSSYYELLHKLRVAYALLGTSQTRRQLLAVRILAVSNLAYISSETAFQQRFSAQDREEPKRQQFAYQLADLLHFGSREPQQVPLQLQAHAINALRALTKQKSMLPDLSGALNISANHGTLLFVLQKALHDLGEDGGSSDDADGDEWRESLFSLLHVILLSSTPPTRSGEIFASPQLISSYVSVLRLRTKKAQRVYVEVLHFFDAFFHHVKDGLAVLSHSKAFEAVVDLLNYETTQALDDVSSESGFPAEFRTPSIDYHVAYNHQQTIRSVLPFINGVITQQGAQADRVLRSLIDSQALLSAFRLIIENGSLFGAHVWSEVVKVISTFLNNEPTSYTIIAEAGLSRSFLESIVLHPLSTPRSLELPTVNQAERADPVASENTDTENQMSVDEDLAEHNTEVTEVSCIPENKPQGILAAAEAIANVCQAFSAICLTTAGSEFFQSSGSLDKFFEIFESPAHIKVMKDASVLQILGNSFDELVRHHPLLKSAVMSAVIVMVSRVRHICKWKAWEIGAGAKLWLQDTEGKLKVAGGSDALVREVLPTSQNSDSRENDSLYLQLPNGKRLVAATKITGTGPDQPAPEETDKEGLTVSDYLMPATSFLIGLFENPSLCVAFMDAGGTELVLDLATLQSLPYDFCQSTCFGGVSHELAQVVHMMAETKPHLVLPPLLNRILAVSQNLESFAGSQSQDWACCVDPLVLVAESRLDDPALSISNDGTSFSKSLVVLQLLVNILAEVFSSPMYHARNREQPAPFMQVNLADVYTEVCHKLGDLSAACHRESKSLEKRVSKSWKDATRPNEPVRGSEEEHGGPDQVDAANGRPIPHSIARTSDTPNAGEARAPFDSGDLKSDENTSAFKNLRIVRRLLFQLPQSITQFFTQLGHGLIGRKRLDTYQKQNTLMVGSAIASALIHQLHPQFAKDIASSQQEIPSSDVYCSYFVEVLKSCSNVLFDFNTSPDHAHCLTVVALPFKNQGGLNVLKRLGERFYQDLKSCQVSSDTVETMTAANGGLKTITSILEHLTSAKCVVESAQSNALKSLDRSKPHHFNPAQFLLELRLEALPFVRAIWDSPYAEQASRVVLEKLIAILRHILGGDQEHEAYKSSDQVMIMNAQTQKKFAHSVEKLNTLKSKGYEEALAGEALFRCNNQSAAAEEYCKAYARNPKLKRNPNPPAQLESPVAAASSAPTPEEVLTHTNELDDRATAATTVTPPLGASSAGQPLLDLLSTLQQTESPSAAVLVPPDGESSSLFNNVDSEGNRQVQGSGNPTDDSDQALDETHDSQLKPANGKGKEPLDEDAVEEKPLATVETMNSQREQIRTDLTEHSLNIINSHYDITWELSELLKSATKRLSEQEAAEFREAACSLLVTSLVSFQSDLEADELSESTRKKISAYAHFVALLIQDKDIYKECLPHLQASFDSLLGFVQIPSKESNNEASLPWIGQVLLIIERMLSDDAEPRKSLGTCQRLSKAPYQTKQFLQRKRSLPLRKRCYYWSHFLMFSREWGKTNRWHFPSHGSLSF